jgi:hypothetical protein
VSRIDVRVSDAGIVHHNVEPAERPHRLVDKHLQISEPARIGFDSNRLITELADLLFERVSRAGMSHIVYDDIGTLPGEFENNRLAYPAISAGDDSYLTL